MKIVAVEPIPVTYPEPNDFNAYRHLCLVKVTADDGQVGWGESITMWPEASMATAAVIDGLAELIIGKDPVSNDALYRAMKNHNVVVRLRGRHRLLRHLGAGHRPVGPEGQGAQHERHEAAGRGRCTSGCPASPPVTPTTPRSPPCARRRWIGSRRACRGSRPASASAARPISATSTTATWSTCGPCARAIGPEKQLMIDMGIKIRWDVTTAVRRCEAFDEYDLNWIEEPLGAWDPEGYRTLRDKTSTLIAYGEREWTLKGFERLLETGTVDVIGCDPRPGRGHHRLQEDGRAGGVLPAARPTPTPGRRPSSARPAWRSASRARPARCSSSSRCATPCSTTW